MSEAVAEATTEPVQEQQGTSPSTPAAPESKQETKAPAPSEPKTVEELPAWAQKQIADLRKVDGDERIASKTLAALQKVLSPDAPDEKPDPAKLAEQLTAKDDTIRTLKVEAALGKAARAAGADEDLLDAVLTRKGSLKELDPSEKDFAKKLDALVKAELDGNPKLRAARAAGQSGSDFAGGSGEGAITKAKFDAMTPAEKNGLFRTDPDTYRRFAGR